MEINKMNSNKETARDLPDVRIILAMLWVAEVLSSLNGDTYRSSDPAVLNSLLENSASVSVTPELLCVMSMIFVIPIFMSVFTLTLKPSMSRRMNRIVGLIYALIILVFWILGFVLKSAIYEFVWSTAQLVFMLLIVYYAWKWKAEEPKSTT